MSRFSAFRISHVRAVKDVCIKTCQCPFSQHGFAWLLDRTAVRTTWMYKNKRWALNTASIIRSRGFVYRQIPNSTIGPQLRMWATQLFHDSRDKSNQFRKQSGYTAAQRDMSKDTSTTPFSDPAYASKPYIRL